MDLITVILLAAGLCFDSFAVSLSTGAACGKRNRWTYVRFSVILALFQGVMPLLGWGVAVELKPYIEALDHWIAFGLLTLLGVKMIKDSLSPEEGSAGNPLALDRNMILAVATSIDALITGAVMGMVEITIIPSGSAFRNMLLAAGIIGFVTFVSAMSGLFFGRRASDKLGGKAVMAGGVVLIVIGLKILLEHFWGITLF